MPIDALGLPRGWLSIDLPGYREAPEPSTYAGFSFEGLPELPGQLDGELAWLHAQPQVEESLAGGHDYDGDPARPATKRELAQLMAGIDVRLPTAFETFVCSPEPRSRVRSATACYLDLADFLVSVPGGGWMIHFLSDQQWVCHWLLYVDGAGAEAVVSTSAAYGFDVSQDGSGFDVATPDRFAPGPNDILVADSFAEFLYRFWIENEIWFALTSGGDLTPDQRRYAEHYK
jgi:hypothetical protein